MIVRNKTIQHGAGQWRVKPSPRRTRLAHVWLLSTLLILGVLAQTTRAQLPRGDSSALIEQALSEPTQITLERVKLGVAIREITDQTGVDITMAPAVMALVPGGAEAEIQRVEIANVPLREGLWELLSPLGMTFEVVADHVEIIPTAPIRCLGRAPTWEELDTLDWLRRIHLGADPSAPDQLRTRIQFQVRSPDPWAELAGSIRSVGVGAGDEVLTIACRNLGWVWCLSGNNLLVTPGELEIVRRLQRRISLRMSLRPLYDVMVAVGEAADVVVRVEPGSLASLPPSVQRNFTLEVAGQTAERALETIAAYTGLGYLIERDGVLFYQASSVGRGNAERAEQPNPAGTDDPYVGKVVVPVGGGGSVEWLVRWSELPVDLRDRRREDLRAAFEAVRARSSVEDAVTP